MNRGDKLMILSDEVKKWLIESQPWVEYNTRKELLVQREDNEEVVDSKKRLLNHPLIQEVISEVKEWPGYALKRHNDAKHLTHKLAFLTDLGLKKDDHPVLAKVAEKILTDQSEEGAFQIIANVPVHFGGSGEDELAWMLCDSPTVLYSMIKMGYAEDKRVEKAINHTSSLIRENGWPCAASPKFGKFKGPGRKDDPCPYANLISLKILVNSVNGKNKDISEIGAKTLLNLWTFRKEKKPFLFAMGTDFSKLKAPLIWYDILHITDVLSQFDWLRNDERLLEMINIIRDKADETGRYTAESVWRAYKDWDFGQKKVPSPWITFSVYKILNRFK